jgi:mannose-6-phosphate isomerase class I
MSLRIYVQSRDDDLFGNGYAIQCQTISDMLTAFEVEYQYHDGDAEHIVIASSPENMAKLAHIIEEFENDMDSEFEPDVTKGTVATALREWTTDYAKDEHYWSFDDLQRIRTQAGDSMFWAALQREADAYAALAAETNIRLLVF